MTGTAQDHFPVMLNEVVAALAPKNDEILVDGTFGGGGYTRALLEKADCQVIAIDRDPTAFARGQEMAKQWGGRLIMLQGCFGTMTTKLKLMGVEQVDGIALDIGVSSMQIDQAERGFSFAKDGPLDMRMDCQGNSAADLVNTASETHLANIIFHYGEEHHARKVARAIVERRKQTPFSTTGDLAETVRSVVPRSKDGIDPATRTFQALRIAVNDELSELERGLEAAELMLRRGGRLAVVTFHSLEDRIVKDFLKSRSGGAAHPSRHIPVAAAKEPPPSFTSVTRKPIVAGFDELLKNPRSRSAHLRCAVRTAAPPLSRPYYHGSRP